MVNQWVVWRSDKKHKSQLGCPPSILLVGDEQLRAARSHQEYRRYSRSHQVNRRYSRSHQEHR